MSETGPMFGVDLIDVLPLGAHGLKQEMPSRQDLIAVAESNVLGADRVAAAYEVLLQHFQQTLIRTQVQAARVEQIVTLLRGLRDDLKSRAKQATIDAGTAYEKTVPRDVSDPSVRYFIGASENLSDFLVKVESALRDAEKIIAGERPR